MSARLPDWIREKKVNLRDLHEIKSLLRAKSLHSVCESLACPNRGECFSRGTATFMILGDVCTRSCGFCNVTTGRPYAPPSPHASVWRVSSSASGGGPIRSRSLMCMARPSGQRWTTFRMLAC